ncbi:MAG TPA: alpha-amylase family glycosyl hydrolase [Chthoniobacterales bacterium]|nr:alpha-amylase family glycosyl hydrolase [Chthoniobacterales bacterium]
MLASGNTVVRFAIAEEMLQIDYSCDDIDRERTVFVALKTDSGSGSAVVPFGEYFEGSTVFLPFQANKLYLLRMGAGTGSAWQRTWENWKWSERREADKEMDFEVGAGGCGIRLPLATLGKKVSVILYCKDFTGNKNWGRLCGAQDPLVVPGEGDKYIPHYCEVDLGARDAPAVKVRGRLGHDGSRPRIYQLFVRLFGNNNETRRPNGSLATNGVGKFNDINDAALASLQKLGISHIWLTGVLQQATGTDYSDIGQPVDDPDLLKGIAGSPYAIKDYFDVCPDYAVDPRKRLAEFKTLLERLHQHRLKALIDFVPNHVARCYHSDIKPEINFGTNDDRAHFFDPRNNFFYLPPNEDGPPLKMPTWQDGVALSPTCKLEGMSCDGRFEGELDHGKVTGNNVVSWKPSLGDWYETVKLNYGFDFTDPAKQRRAYPSAWQPDAPVPDTWTKMDQVITYWQAMGVDGFRCDMAHMEPPEFWKWLIGRARERSPDVFFMGEAYDSDPAKVPGSDPVISLLHGGRSNVMFDLLDAGFDAVYDDPSYKALKNIYDGPGWANDLDHARSDDFIFENSVRYAENHDEVRLAGRDHWGGLGMGVGFPVAAILYGIGRGSLMLYNGQEVGEPAEGAEGFGGDDARTTIFDYWSMPELVKWTNGHEYDGARLSPEQRELRAGYGRLLAVTSEAAFCEGAFFGLNPANNQNPKFGRIGMEPAGGHWLYAFLRFDPVSRQRFLVVVNLHPREELRETRILFPDEAIDFLRFEPNDNKTLHLAERLAGELELEINRSTLAGPDGLALPALAPLTPYFFEISMC